MSGQTSQTTSLYSDSKARLCDRIASNIQSAGSVTRQIIKGSKCVETLNQSARSLAALDNTIDNTYSNIKKLEISTKQFQMQLEDINNSCQQIREVVDKMN
ncbi:uncharacterized protein LOC128964746 [Oppia nitens]|uniref:uncharacterized protein LOC128964746 n=1 Tax=Oppia nitens TaxID=1686743 RepID=UPI0023DB0801|nr:uncharacterized protein LOC128964746 [Oppia nitens]